MRCDPAWSARKRVWVLRLAAVFSLAVFVAARFGEAAGGSADVAERPPLRVVCTTGMIADIARAVAGERAEVVGLIGSGVDPHLFKPTRMDVSAVMRADVVFYNGLMLEGRMTDLLVRAASAGRRVYAVTEALDGGYLIEPDGFEGHPDPHVWMDPAGWRSAVGVVRDRLSEADPGGVATYALRASEYEEKLRAFEAYAEGVLSTVPEPRRVLVTAHDAFGYFGRRFEFEVVGIQGISTESEAGIRDVERLVSLLVDRRIPAVFTETTVTDRNVAALIAGARAKGHTVALGGKLFSDAMGSPGTYEGTYIGMMDHNVSTVAAALGGVVPVRGFQGMLSEDVAGRGGE